MKNGIKDIYENFVLLDVTYRLGGDINLSIFHLINYLAHKKEETDKDIVMLLYAQNSEKVNFIVEVTKKLSNNNKKIYDLNISFGDKQYDSVDKLLLTNRDDDYKNFVDPKYYTENQIQDIIYLKRLVSFLNELVNFSVGRTNIIGEYLNIETYDYITKLSFTNYTKHLFHTKGKI